MIKNLSIENFRGISKLKIDDFKRINLIVGKNNSGKTTILEALFILCAPNNINLPLNTNAFRGLTLIHDNIWRSFFYKQHLNKKIKLDCTFWGKKSSRSLRISPHFEKINGTVTFNGDSNRNDIETQRSLTSTKNTVNGLIYDVVMGTRSNKKKYKAEIFSTPPDRPSPFQINSFNAEGIEIRGVFVNSETYQNSQDLIKRFENVVLRKKIDRIINVLQKIEPSLVDIKIVNNIIYCDVGADELLPLHSLGDGIVRLLSIILSFVEIPNGILLVDEIDSGFHYSSLNSMWRAVLETAKEYNTQVFATTHSLDCLLSYSQINAGELFANDDVCLYRIEKSNDSLTYTNYDLETLRASIDSDWEVR